MSTPAVGLADLLAVLHHLKPQEHAEAARAAGFVVCVREKDQAQTDPLPALDPPKPRGIEPEPVDVRQRHTRTTPDLWHWKVSEVQDLPMRSADRPDWLAQSWTAAAFVSAPGATRPPHQPLIKAPRLGAVWRRLLAEPREDGKVDVAAVVCDWARGRALVALPRRRRPRWPPRLQVVLDDSRHLRPLNRDLWLWVLSLNRLLGQRLQLTVVRGLPVREPAPGRLEWPVCCDGSPVLALSDLGASNPSSGAGRMWSALAKAVADRGGRPQALSPLDEPARVAACGWQPWSVSTHRVGPQRRRTAGHTTPEVEVLAQADIASAPEAEPLTGERALLAALLGNPDVDASLLRALRLTLQTAGVPTDAADEVSVWQSPWVQSDSRACTLTSVGVTHAERWWHQLPASLREALSAVHWQHLAGASPLVRAEYAQSMLGALPTGSAMDGTLAQGREDGERLMLMAAALQSQAPTGDAASLAADVRDFLRHQIAQRSGLSKGAGPAWEWAWAWAHRDEWDDWRQKKLLPPWLSPDTAQWIELPQPVTPQMALRVVQVGADGRSRLELAPWRYPMASLAWMSGADRLRVQVRPGDIATQRGRAMVRLPAAAWQAVLASLLAALPAPNRSDREQHKTLETTLRDQPQDAGPGFERWNQELLGLMRRVDAERGVPSWSLSLIDELPAVRESLRAAPHRDQWISVDHAAVLPTSEAQVTVRGSEQSLALKAFTRPAWVDELWHEGAQLWARTTDGRDLVWMPRSDWTILHLDEAPESFRLPHGFWWDFAEARLADHGQMHCPSWAARHGVDEHGYWAEFDLPPHPDDRTGLTPLETLFDAHVTQRLRFIPPGRFWMGSPQAEDGRFDDESLHPVTLTRGYWLADTACTQALWQAVVGRLPKGQAARGDELPVVNVSHDDIETLFLPALARLLPDLHARLPSEAEWEQAARAGSITAYPWGDVPDSARMNWDGKALMPVRSFAANDWGLWQMQGNVWEWCSDALSAYPNDEALDPRSETGAGRVLRGGSWVNLARNCRSARRGAIDPGKRGVGFGFRLARGLPEAGRAEPGGRTAEPARSVRPDVGAPDANFDR